MSDPDDRAPDDSTPDALRDAVDEAVEPARQEAIMRVWQSVMMTNVESVRPPRDDDDPVRRLYDLGRPENLDDPDPDDEPPS
jgi:hypothetical protein